MTKLPTDIAGNPVAGEGAHPESVARYLVEAVPTGRPEESAGALRVRLIERRYDDALHVFLVNEDGRLVGIGNVMAAAATTPLKGLARAINSHVVTPTTDREEAASTAISGRRFGTRRLRCQRPLYRCSAGVSIDLDSARRAP